MGGSRGSPLPQGRGSKPVRVTQQPPASSRPSRRGVDRNNAGQPRRDGCARGRPSRRGVDRNGNETSFSPRQLVAPPAGAWIETSRRAADSTRERSPLPQGRGSKRQLANTFEDLFRSPLPQGRGSKPLAPLARLQRHGRPSRRGVDRNMPIWRFILDFAVAPPAGAWIETLPGRAVQARSPSPLPQGRGSKQAYERGDLTERRRPSRRGVDRNWPNAEDHIAGLVAPPAGAWIETFPKPRAPGSTTSPLPQGRGSKQRSVRHRHRIPRSPLPQGRGSKHAQERRGVATRGSPLP